MEYSAKLVYQSNHWYNDGLEKARIRDLSGAITSLKKSLQYNTANIASRNLLGLVYYGRGDVVEALKEWVLSKHIKSHENIANYYISKVQDDPIELEGINEAIKRYNQSLQYAQQGGEDLAIIQLKKAVAEHPTYVKAYQLLAFLYLHTEQYSAARQALRTANNLDKTDELTLRYMHELSEIRREQPISVRKENKEQQTVTYTIGNETIIQPISTVEKENNVFSTVMNIALGLIVGVLVMWFLVMPAANSSKQKDLNKQTVAFSDKIAEQEAQISALKKELEMYRASNEQTEDAKATAISTQSSYEVLVTVAEHYRNQSLSNEAMVKELLTIKKDALGTAGRAAYEEMTGTLFPTMCETLYGLSKENFDVANYPTGITNLELIMQMDEKYQDGNAMLLLAQCYDKNGDKEKALQLYQKVVDMFPDSQVEQDAKKASEALEKPQDGTAEPEKTPAGDASDEDAAE